MNNLIKFKYVDTEFIVQSYLKNDFANICEINGESYNIDFIKKQITNPIKTQDWKLKSSKMIFAELEEILKTLFSFKYCQNEIEDRKKCKIQCEHCKEYYKSLEFL